MKKTATLIALCLVFTLFTWTFASAGEHPEVDKGKIPATHIDAALKTLPWGVRVWDVDEGLAGLKGKNQNILWIDTRPASFFTDGTVKGAINLEYDKADSKYDATAKVLTKETLEAAVTAAGMTMDKVTVAIFCQGPKCHRSYNATIAAVQDWGLDAAQIVWFRAGYPDLVKEIKGNPKLLMRANRFVQNVELG